MMIRWAGNNSGKLLISLSLAWILTGICCEFYSIAWGTGIWWGEFAFTWALLYLGCLLFCIALFLVVTRFVWREGALFQEQGKIARVRSLPKWFHWLAGLVLMALPIFLFQYTAWGAIFHGFYFRTMVWLVVVLFVSVIITEGESLLGWRPFLAVLVVSAAINSIAVSLRFVTSYPFSLGWSEGNRMWDYSLLFGSDLYLFSPDNPAAAYLDLGRQLSGGLPFLLPTLTILQERLWLGIMGIIPYVILGWIAFRLPGSGLKLFPFLAGLWAWIFLNQGPIHAPLLWCAVLVAIAWGRPMWLAIPLVALAAYFATLSRDTWVFAPAMWSVMLELGSAPVEQFRPLSRSGWRVITLGLAGLAGIPFSTRLISIGSWLKSSIQSDTPAGIAPSVTSAVTDQPLLWYRLLPNATYGNGILLGLLIAVLPVLIILVYLYISRTWVLNIWQRLAVILPLIAFLVVGLIVSTKIGGGGDLHNMDMFLIGVLFAGALAWKVGGAEWIGGAGGTRQWLRIIILSMIAIPGYKSLMSLHPISFTGDRDWLVRLTDSRSTTALGLLVSEEMTQSILEMVQHHVEEAQTRGDVLFMDQRQLLTFGYIHDVKLVWEYEKKRMMDEALSGNESYFEPFYDDLAAHRFSLIISDPLRSPIKYGEYQFGEENNAWWIWVSEPVLCYYEPIKTENDFRLQLLAPREGPVDCSRALP